MKRTNRLTEGNILHTLIRFAVPVFFTLFLQALYGGVDLLVVGQFAATADVSGVATGSMLMSTVTMVITGLSMGITILVGERIGRGEPDEAGRAIGGGICLFAAFGVLLTVVLLAGAEPLARLLHAPEEAFAETVEYIRICGGGSLFIVAYNVLGAVFRGIGDARTPLFTVMLACVINIGGDLLLVEGFHLGAAGAALATVISQGISGLACLVYMIKKFPILHMSPEERRLDGRSCRTLCFMGVPMGLQYSITAVGSIFLQSAVNGLGSLYVAAVAAGAKLFQLLGCPYDALGATMATYCGQNVGAVKLDRLGKGIRACSLLGLIYALAAFGAMLLFAPQSTMLFLDPTEPQLDTLVALTAQYVRILTAFFFPLALVNIVRFSIQGMGYSGLAILAGVMEMIARMAVALVFVPLFGYTAACFASPAAWICADAFLIPACMGSIARLKKIYAKAPEA